MSVKLRASSGSYNVRASELQSQVQRPNVTKTVHCIVFFLDETQATFHIDKRAKAQILLDKVFEHLELIEKDYFGLEFADATPDDPQGVRWLDPLKILKKQIRVGPPYMLYFRVKFYVSDPSKLHEEYTRYHFFLQVKKDIASGKLVVPFKSAVILASYAVQSELGDYHPEEHGDNYLSDFIFLPTQSNQFNQEVSELHRKHKGLNPAECEMDFLDKVSEIACYGVDLHQAYWDQSSTQIQLGVTSLGLVVFQNNVKINTFAWAKIIKISFKRKQFFIQLRKESNDNIENLIGFNMVSYRSCKNLWKSCVEHHTFFRLHSPPQPKASIFSIGTKFRYSGRTEFQTLEDSKRRARIERTFTRTPSKQYARRTVGATTRDVILTERNAIDGCSNTPHSNSLDSFRYHGNSSGPSSAGSSPLKGTANHIPSSTSYPNSFSSSNTRTVSPVSGVSSNTGHAGYAHKYPASSLSGQTSVNSSMTSFQHTPTRSTLPTDYKPNGYNAPVTNNGGWPPVRHTPSPAPSLVRHTPSPAPSLPVQVNRSDSRNSRSYESASLDRKDRKPLSLENRTDYSRMSQTLGAAESRSLRRSKRGRANTPTITAEENKPNVRREADDEGGFRNQSHRRSRNLQTTNAHSTKGDNLSTCGYSHSSKADNYAPAVPPKTYLDDTDSSIGVTDQSYELPVYNQQTVPNGNAHESHGLVTIRMKPDAQGRFGFNVKGGSDQGMPIIVSRVAPGTPADVCIPRLNEGDQVLFINGRDVSSHKHEQVVMFIRSAVEQHSRELVLIVRPNVYIGDDTADNEPDFQYTPDTYHISSTLPPGGDLLSGSLTLLQEGIESGAALAQFEQLYRKKQGLTMNACRLESNVNKNRYRDISPYDLTRVKIRTGTGDYINANYVNMEIPGSGIVNRYIAAQGPLPNTSLDFWQMIWEQHCTLVVMLTTNVERGRVKCHKYWPDLYETATMANMQVTCVKEEVTSSFAFREFTLVHSKDGKERHITQIQYISWPDHGVPDDASDFLHFVMRVRQRRSGMTEPTIVHCSAGIGRTGVLITMETAMCLIEANQPVYPLDIVRQMRDQRAMLIQTSSQYKFVCEAILKVYNDKVVQPLEEFKT